MFIEVASINSVHWFRTKKESQQLVWVDQICFLNNIKNLENIYEFYKDYFVFLSNLISRPTSQSMITTGGFSCIACIFIFNISIKLIDWWIKPLSANIKILIFFPYKFPIEIAGRSCWYILSDHLPNSCHLSVLRSTDHDYKRNLMPITLVAVYAGLKPMIWGKRLLQLTK